MGLSRGGLRRLDVWVDLAWVEQVERVNYEAKPGVSTAAFIGACLEET
jgi:hypothetical protein